MFHCSLSFKQDLNLSLFIFHSCPKARQDCPGCGCPSRCCDHRRHDNQGREILPLEKGELGARCHFSFPRISKPDGKYGAKSFVLCVQNCVIQFSVTVYYIVLLCPMPYKFSLLSHWAFIRRGNSIMASLSIQLEMSPGQFCSLYCQT